MSARNNILKRIGQNKPGLKPLPFIELTAVSAYPDLVQQFSDTLAGIGGRATHGASMEGISGIIDELSRPGIHVIVHPALRGMDTELAGEEITLLAAMTTDQLEFVEHAFLRAELAVAENGSVWLYESQLGNRLLPFICQHLHVVVDKSRIVATMHQAYAQIDPAREGYGLFLAGPSKTADIEQSLVIGAHGARSLTVYLV